MTYRLLGSCQVIVEEEFDDLVEAIERGREIASQNSTAALVVVGEGLQVSLLENSPQVVA